MGSGPDQDDHALYRTDYRRGDHEARRLMRNPARQGEDGPHLLLPAVAVIATAVIAAVSSSADAVALADVDPGRCVGASWRGPCHRIFTAHHQEFALDYETGTITSKATPLGTIPVGRRCSPRALG